MKANRIERKGHRRLIVIGVVAVLILLAVAFHLGYGTLVSLYREPCLIADMSAQVEIHSGKMVHPGTIAEEFGLKAGRNLAEIDFAGKRADILKRIPNLREITVTRQLPDRVIIVAEERAPVARLALKGQRASGRVVDTDGVVFLCQRGTQLLPVIFARQSQDLRPGNRIAGRLLAALRLVEACREPELAELGVLSVDTFKHDFLVMTLGNYSKVKILWDEMDESTVRSRADLTARLIRLRDAIRSRVTPDTVIWNVTVPGEIYADTQGKL